MITIEFLQEEIEGEPGPNFYWRGEPKDFIRLLVDMHSLGCKENVEIDLSKYGYIQLRSIDNLRAISSRNGKLLCKRDGNKIEINLKMADWRELLRYFLIISFYPSHLYVDFEGMGLYEDANFIISSEG